MKTSDQKLPSDQIQGDRKKVYRKPNVQVYGTLAQLTGSTAQPATHVQDGSSGGGNPSNRT